MVISRRRMLAGALGGAAIAAAPLRRARAAAPGGLHTIEHVVITVQENRSFDHFFGTLSGVRGFDDPSALPGVFRQAWNGPGGRLAPFHLNSHTTAGACHNDITHAWVAQHQSWNGGRMDRWARVHAASDGAAYGPATMGYYTRADLPTYYALADAFTLCDGYHCSVLGPSQPNQLYTVSATIDPDGKAGGPVLDNVQVLAGTGGPYSWTTMPERLQRHGVSWKAYQTIGTGPETQFADNPLPLFAQFQDPRSELYRNAFLPSFPGEFEADVAAGTLPSVSWVYAPPLADEHPPSPSAYGEVFLSRVFAALTSNPKVWAKTVWFVTFDENGGFFDHVPPAVPPPGTRGEYLTTRQLPPSSGGIRGPIGLGFRVPLLVVSPFSRGGWVCSDTFDHTSPLRFIESRFGVEVPNLSAWRRGAVGDLTSALDVAHPDVTVPRLPDPTASAVDATVVCLPSLIDLGTGQNPPGPSVPSSQSPPHQEAGKRKRRR